MDVNKIKAAIRAGILYREIDTDLNNLYISGEISKEEFDALSRQIEELENKEMSRGRTPDLVIEQAPSSREENTISKEEDDNVTALNTVSETVAEPVVPVVENESSTEASAEETREEPQQEGQPASENSASEEESREDTNKEAPQWVSDYRNYMMEWSVRNPERKLEKFEQEESSYRADFKDGVALNFSSPTNVAVKAADPDSPKASDFDALIDIAKKSNQNIRLSDNMSDEFRKALIEACATADVKITNLSKEDAELYLSFVTKEEDTQEQQDVVNDAEKDVSAPAEEEPKAPVEEAVVETTAQDEVVETPVEENAPIAMPASLSDEVLKDDAEELFGDIPTADGSKEDDSDSLFNFENTSSKEEEKEIPFEILGSVGETEDKAPVEEAPVEEAPAPVNEISAEEAPKEGLFKRVKNRVKRAKTKVSLAMVGLGSAAAIGAPSCNTPTQNQGQNTGGYEEYIDTAADALQDDTLQLTTADFAPTATTVVPTEWDASMKVNKATFNKVRKLKNFDAMYTNAHMLKDTFKMSEMEMISSWYNLMAWTTSPNAKGDARYNSGILAPYGLENLSRALNCGDTLIVENIENYKIMLNAGNNDRGNVNVNILSGLNGRFANLNHDAEGYLIGSTCNRVAFIYECGSEKDVHYIMRDCDCQNVTARIEVVTQPDTTPAPVVEYVEPVVEEDTVQVETPAPEVRKAKAPQAPKFVTVATTSNLGEAPMNGFMTTVSDGANESYVTKGTKGAAKRMSKQLARAGVDAQTSEEFRKEVKDPNSSKVEAQEKAKQQSYEWQVNASRDDR